MKIQEQIQMLDRLDELSHDFGVADYDKETLTIIRHLKEHLEFLISDNNRKEKPITSLGAYAKLRTAIENHTRLDIAYEIYKTIPNDFSPDVHNTLQGLLWQSVTDAKTKVTEAAKIYLDAVSYETENTSRTCPTS